MKEARLAALLGRLATAIAVALGLPWGCLSPTKPSEMATPIASSHEAVATPGTVSRADAAPGAVSTGAFAMGKHGAVTSSEPLASGVGLDILRRGGNAVDAAIAVAFALGVTEPSAGNIGGGGFMMVYAPGVAPVAIDYREVAPLAAHRNMFLDAAGNLTDRSERGPLAAGIPGVVAGLALAHRRFGRLQWSELIEPAIALARDGHRLDAEHAQVLGYAAQDVQAFYQAVAEHAATLTGESLTQAEALLGALAQTRVLFSSAKAAGELWQQPELAKTLEMLATQGARAFYEGAFAQGLAQQVKRMGGIWTARDLQQYVVIEREPLRFSYRGHEILTMPPPSAGGVVLRQLLAAAEVLDSRSLAWESPERIHLFIESARRAYADRNQLLGDPAFVKMPLEQLLSLDYAKRRVSDIDRRHASASSSIGTGLPIAEGSHTTHFSVIDGSGMAVANTFTLNTNFGALVQVPGTGLTLNNEMDDFSAKPGAKNVFGLVQGELNAIEPGKRMLSSMSPTIVLRSSNVRAVLGSPGGPTITTTVAQVLLQLLDYERPLTDAIAAPRVHEQWFPDEVLVEAALPQSTQHALRAMGHRLQEDAGIGHANCIEVDLASGLRTAVADVARGGGGAAAY